MARADHADPLVARGRGRAPGRGEDHLDDGDVVALAGIAQHRGAGGVARDDQRLHAALVEVVEALEGVLADLADGLLAVGLARGVAEVDDRLVRELVDDGARDGQPAEAGVEDADRGVGGLSRHGRRHRQQARRSGRRGSRGRVRRPRHTARAGLGSPRDHAYRDRLPPRLLRHRVVPAPPRPRCPPATPCRAPSAAPPTTPSTRSWPSPSTGSTPTPSASSAPPDTPPARPHGHRRVDLNARTEHELTITLPNHTGMVTGRRIEAATAATA